MKSNLLSPVLGVAHRNVRERKYSLAGGYIIL